MLAVITTISVWLAVLDDPSSILKSIQQAYKGDFTITVDATYRYYPDLEARTCTDSMRSTLIMHDNDFYFMIGYLEFVQQGNYFAICDQSSKVISVSNASPDGILQSTFSLTDILEQKDIKVIPFEAGSNKKGISILMSGPTVEADLIVDENNYVQKCTLKYQDGVDWNSKKGLYSRLEITYRHPQKSKTPFPEKTYGLNRFLSKKLDGSISLTPSYSQFQLTDNTH